MEIEILTAQVKEQVLTITTSHTFVADTQNIYTASFSFDREWDGFAKTVIFRSENHIRFAILDDSNKCIIPAEVIEADRIEIGIQGNKDGQVITTKRADRVKIYESGGSINMIPAPFEQSEFDKLMDELAQVRQIAEQSIADAEQTHADAEQVAADSKAVAESKAVVLQKAAEVATNTTAAKAAATTATAQAAISQNLHDQLEPMNVDVSSKAPSIISEAAGSVITLDDSSNMPLQSITIYGKSTQDGTPTPDAPVEIVSGDNPVVVARSFNLFDQSLLPSTTLADGGVKIVNNGDGSFTVNKTIDSFHKDIMLKKVLSKEIISKILNVGDIILNLGYDNVLPYFYLSARNQDTKFFELNYKNKRATLSKDLLKEIVSLEIGFFSKKDTIFESGTIKPMVYQHGDGTWEPFKECLASLPYTLRGIPVTSGGNYTDAEGQQWVCDTIEINADGTGKFVQRVGVVNLKDLEVSVYNFSISEKIFSFIFNITNGITTKKTNICMCNRFPISIEMGNNQRVNTVRLGYERSQIVLVTDIASTVEEMTAYLNANETLFAYPLKTPVETNLKPEEVTAFQALHTHKKNTTIFNSAGLDQQVEYAADTKTYIDNKFTELQNAILSTGGNV